MSPATIRRSLEVRGATKLVYGPFRASWWNRWRCHRFAKRADAKGWVALRITDRKYRTVMVVCLNPEPEMTGVLR